jgi:hypothetical protein
VLAGRACEEDIDTRAMLLATSSSADAGLAACQARRERARQARARQFVSARSSGRVGATAGRAPPSFDLADMPGRL